MTRKRQHGKVSTSSPKSSFKYWPREEGYSDLFLSPWHCSLRLEASTSGQERKVVHISQRSEVRDRNEDVRREIAKKAGTGRNPLWFWYLISSRWKLHREEGLTLDLPSWETHWNRVSRHQSSLMVRHWHPYHLQDPPCVQSLQTAGRCSSYPLSSPLLGLTAPHARSRPGLLSVQHWSHCQLLNGGCCFLKKDSKSIRSWLGWPRVPDPCWEWASCGSKAGHTIERPLGLGNKSTLLLMCWPTHLQEKHLLTAGPGQRLKASLTSPSSTDHSFPLCCHSVLGSSKDGVHLDVGLGLQMEILTSSEN